MSRRVSPPGVVSVAVIAVVSGFLAAGPAAASDPSDVLVSKELTYTCEFPIIGPQPITATVSVDLPATAPVGTRIQPENLSIDFTLAENIVTAFRLIGAKTMEADAWADVDVAFGGRSLTFAVPNLHAEKQEIPASGTMTSSLTGPMPSFILSAPGTLDIAAGQEFVANVEALDENGEPTGLGNPIPVPCTQDAGQDPSLGSITITGAASASGSSVAPLGAIDKELTYSCVFPIVEEEEVVGRVTATFPDQAKVNERAAITDPLVQVTFNQTTTDALRAIKAATVAGDGQVDLHASLTDANGSLDIVLGLPVIIPSVDVPPTGTMTVALPITTPTLIFRSAGELSVSAGDLNGTLTPLKADGTPTEAGTFDVPCQPLAGQDTHLGTVPIVN